MTRAAPLARAEPEPRRLAVVFDLWGTLVPFEPAVTDEMLRRIAAALDAPHDTLVRVWDETWPERATGDIVTYVRNLSRRMKLRPTQAQLEAAITIRVETQARMFVPRADAVPTLTRLRTAGIRTALVTNCSSELPALWRRSALAGMVDAEVFSSHEHLMKPDRRIYELAASRLSIEPQDAIFIGDGGDHELEGAKVVGMKAILLRPGDTNPPSDWTGPELSSLSQVASLLVVA